MKVKKLNENFELIENTSVFKCSSGDLNENMLEEDNFVYYRDIHSRPVSHLFWNDSKEAWVTDPSEATIFSNNEEIENRAETIIQSAMKKFQKSRDELLKNYILQGHKSILDKLHSKKQETTQAEKDYREFANIDESFEIKKENIDFWALNEAANKNSMIRADLEHILLGEEISIDKASRALETEAEMATDQTIIETELDKSLKRALWMQKRGIKSNFPNKLFVSQPGAGKTSIIYQWADANDVNIVYKDCKTMDLASLGGILTKPASPDDPYAGRLATKEFHSLNAPRTVLFLDELNRAPGNIQGSLLTLINDHVVWDPSQKGEKRYLENFLFTVAAINPPSIKDPALKPLGTAMSNRFKRVPTPGKPHETLRYLRNYYNNLLKQEDDEEMIKELKGKLRIAETVLQSPRFTYDTAVDEDEMADDPSYQSLSPRSFVDALENSDGTKQGFLDEWSDWCNYKKKHTIEDILSDYVDIEDKANDALKADSESSVFKKEMSARAKLKKAFAELNI